MAIDRIGTAANAQILLAQLRKAESALDQSNKQVSSGKLSDTYSGYGTKVATLEAARSKAAHADADAQTATQALTQLDLQDAQLSQLSDLANTVKQAISDAMSSGDASSLMTDMEGYFDQAVQILNSKNGETYLYGGENGSTQPVTASSIYDLVTYPAAPMSISSIFTNGSTPRSVRVGDGQTSQIGLLASDVGTQLFTLFRDVAQFNAGTPFTSATDGTQQAFLESAVTQATDAASAINEQAAANGSRYNAMQDTVDRLKASSTVYKGFVSNIEDADMGEAVAKLNQNQVALQATLQVVAGLNNMTLLNYL